MPSAALSAMIRTSAANLCLTTLKAHIVNHRSRSTAETGGQTRRLACVCVCLWLGTAALLPGDDRTAVFVVGGVTRAELAGIKLMPNVCTVMTTSILTGNRLLDGITQI